MGLSDLHDRRPDVPARPGPAPRPGGPPGRSSPRRRQRWLDRQGRQPQRQPRAGPDPRAVRVAEVRPAVLDRRRRRLACLAAAPGQGPSTTDVPAGPGRRRLRLRRRQPQAVPGAALPAGAGLGGRGADGMVGGQALERATPRAGRCHRGRGAGHQPAVPGRREHAAPRDRAGAGQGQCRAPHVCRYRGRRVPAGRR
ncbi:unnamed protein product [Rotaria sp. Silwood1]|nr:unnamed protein product [Rotaria sp. Silwood1]